MTFVENLRGWAAEKQAVSRVWLFGSRASQRAQPESDLDIAVELTRLPHDPNDFVANLFLEEELGPHWKQEWRQELQAICPVKVGFSIKDQLSPAVISGVGSDGILVYSSRAAEAVESPSNEFLFQQSGRPGA